MGSSQNPEQAEGIRFTLQDHWNRLFGLQEIYQMIAGLPSHLDRPIPMYQINTLNGEATRLLQKLSKLPDPQGFDRLENIFQSLRGLFSLHYPEALTISDDDLILLGKRSSEMFDLALQPFDTSHQSTLDFSDFLNSMRIVEDSAKKLLH